MKNNNNLAYLLLILTTFFWSGNFIVGKAASIYEIPPFSLNFYRWFFACLILMPFTIKELILSLIGVVFIISKANIDILKNLEFNRGDLTMIVAMFSWAIYSALLKKKKYEVSQITLLQIVIICGLIFLIPIYFIEMNMGHMIKLGKPFYLTLTYVVIFPGLASFFFWIKGIALIGANRAGIFLHLMPIFGAIMAMIIFDEKFMFYHFLGAIFIISGITLSNKKTINNVK